MTDSPLAFGTTLRKRRNLFLFLIIFVSLVALIMFLAWPTTTAQSPFWEVWVVNEAGQPIVGMTVTLHYQNYSAEAEGHSGQKQTDACGCGVFSTRSLKGSRYLPYVATPPSAAG